MPTPVFEFTLPRGYQDPQGRLHRNGTMRLATALDEIEPLSDPRVKENEATLGLLLLSRVVTRLGDYAPVPPELIGQLFASDFAYLQKLYFNLNSPDDTAPPVISPGLSASPTPSLIRTVCPNCQAELTLDLSDS